MEILLLYVYITLECNSINSQTHTVKLSDCCTYGTYGGRQYRGFKENKYGTAHNITWLCNVKLQKHQINLSIYNVYAVCII